jgi:hypothetical protein
MINESLDFQGMIPGQLTGSCASSDQDLQFESQEHHHGGRGLGMAKNAGDIRNYGKMGMDGRIELPLIFMRLLLNFGQERVRIEGFSVPSVDAWTTTFCSFSCHVSMFFHRPQSN